MLSLFEMYVLKNNHTRYIWKFLLKLNIIILCFLILGKITPYHTKLLLTKHFASHLMSNSLGKLVYISFAKVCKLLVLDCYVLVVKPNSAWFLLLDIIFVIETKYILLVVITLFNVNY